MRRISIFLGIMFLLILISTTAAALYFLFAFNYEEFLRFFLAKMDKPYLYQKAADYFPESSFSLIRIVSIILTVFVFAVIFQFIRQRQRILHKTDKITATLFATATKHIQESLPKQRSGRLFLLFIMLFYTVRSLLCIILYPIDFDEADTYLLFSSQGPLVSASFYPVPNNHILFSILTSITSWIIPNPETALRLPLVFIGISLLFFLFGFLKRIFSEVAAFAGICFFAGSYPVYLFSFLARGYLLLLLFYIVAFYAFYQLVIQKKNERKYTFLFIIASVGGLYTIPTFLYALAGFGLLWFIHLVLNGSKAGWFGLIKSFLIIGLVTAVLYTPVLITARWETLQPYMNPTYQQTETLTMFQFSFRYMVEYFLSPNTAMAVTVGFVSIAGSMLIFRKLNNAGQGLLLFCFLQILFPFLIFFALRQAFPVKPWMHLTIIIAVLAAAVFHAVYSIFPKLKSTLLLLMCLMLAGETYISYTHREKTSVAQYNSVAAYCEPLIKTGSIKTVYADIPYFKTMMGFYAYKHDQQLTTYSSRKRSNRFEKFDASKKYDLIITATERTLLNKLQYQYDTLLMKENIVVLLIRQ